MRKELFRPAPAEEARLLLLIDAFSKTGGGLEGRTKLAKLDFFLRYPVYFERALKIRDVNASLPEEYKEDETIESRMIRYRYGPWDPAYFALLGSLIGRGLVEPVPVKNGIGYRTTDIGRTLAKQIANSAAWSPVAKSIVLLKRHFDMSGTFLKNFIYENFPEVTSANWGKHL